MKDQAVAGVLHQPFAPSEKEGRTVWALVGFGVFGLKQRPTPNPEKSRIMLLTRSHLTPSTTKLAELLRGLLYISISNSCSENCNCIPHK